MKKNKLLIILQALPYPLSEGGHQAIFNSIDVLRTHYDIYLSYYERKQKKKDKNRIEQLWTEVKFLPYSKDKKFRNAHDFLVRLVNKVCRFFKSCELEYEFTTCINNYSNDYLDYVNNIITNNCIDIVQTEFVQNLSLVTVLPKSVKKVFVHHELRFVRHELVMKEHNLFDASYYTYMYNCLKREELNFLSLYDAIITLSETDKQKLQKENIPAEKIYASFAIVKNNNKEHNPNKFNKLTKTLTFVGPESHSPNKIGLIWFFDNCWNKILNTDNTLQLKIIGKWSRTTQKQWHFKYKNITFLGFVENLYNVLSDSIMIVPITIGSGIRMKILEAVNMGIPFVTTDVGVEGLPFKDGEDCFVCSSPDDFGHKILVLKDNLALQKQFIISANNKINSLYSPEKLRCRNIAVYNGILKQ
jgi:glycosyltransferase involved in cell wall biosynthesis